MTSTSSEAPQHDQQPLLPPGQPLVVHPGRQQVLDQVVRRDLPTGSVHDTRAARELREGRWTRFGNGAVLGDVAAEETLTGLAERSRDAARAQGFAAGWAEGLRASAARSTQDQDEVARRVDERTAQLETAQRSALSALSSAIRGCAETSAALQASLASSAVELALELAEAILGREVETATDPGADALRRAIAVAPTDVPLVVRLNPVDLMALDPATVGERAITLVSDGSLSRGEATVEAETGVVDAGIASALARVREVLFT